MDDKLIGQMVMDIKSKRRGIITSVSSNRLTVSYDETAKDYPFPDAFADTLILKNQGLQETFEERSTDSRFQRFKETYINAVEGEIAFLKRTGGKRYRMIDGERIYGTEGTYFYSFDTDSEMKFPEGTGIKLRFPEETVRAYVITCEDFTMVIQSSEYLGETIESVEFTADSWMLLETLQERICELYSDKQPLAYELACRGRAQISSRRSIQLGQDCALQMASQPGITIIWGPPGTGKTTTLARIAQEYIHKGKRVLMLSYSNVSVDGALLRVADMSDQHPGDIVRYGYPRVKELLESRTLTSYGYILSVNPELADEYYRLQTIKKTLKRKDPERVRINKRISVIRELLKDKERELIQNAAFVATTVSKAVVDAAVYGQKFDIVLFDEASMAYVPQVVFAAGLAKESFCCLGDFRQLSAIVQNQEDTLLQRDIFEYTGVTEAVENGYGHNWLVMLNIQFRMHPSIASFASKYMYQNLLQTADKVFEQRQPVAENRPLPSEPICLVDLGKTYSVCDKTMDGSRINLMSALLCLRIAELFQGQYSVGIITPYSAQSRLILSMIRDLQERNDWFKSVSSATVHQFQGSEKPVIIYDAVDCFRMPYPGTLLTSKKNDSANRLFNVAITRAQGKFIAVANKEYLDRKHLSRDLMFSKLLKETNKLGKSVRGDTIYTEAGILENETPYVFIGDRDDLESWELYLQDIRHAEHEIFMEVPGVLDDDRDAVNELSVVLVEKEEMGVKIQIRTAEEVSLPVELRRWEQKQGYVTTPFTIIDKKVLWFGEPLSAADFISAGQPIETKLFPCLRMEGKYTARSLKAAFGIPTL